MNKEFKEGLKSGIPIALGYFAVSFSLGITMVAAGISAAQGTVMSLSNLTSAGEFAGIRVIAVGGTLAEMVLTQIIINLRYSLMSMSLTQKLEEGISLWKKLIIAFGNTDEIFAVAMSHQKSLKFSFMVGLQLLPIVGWTLGTLLGAIAGNIMPERVSIAMNVMLYGMFIAIVVPAAKKSKPVLMVACIAVVFSCLFRYVPILCDISEGLAISICTVAAAVLGAIFFPIKDSDLSTPKKRTGPTNPKQKIFTDENE